MMNLKTVQTISDIARLAGVSKATVSRALNDSPLINQQTKERIQAIARQHHFHFNATARNLSLRQSHTIAFVAPAYFPQFLSAEDLFGLGMLGGVENGLYILGYDLLVIHADPEDANWAHDYLDSRKVDGFILMASPRRQWQVKILLEMSAPFIAWGTPLPGLNYCSVSGDNLGGGKLAAQHLLHSGRQTIAFLGGPPDELTVQLRLQGFMAEIKAAGRQLEPHQQAYGDYSYASGMTTMLRLLDQAPGLQGVFVNSDLMAIGAIQAIQQRGLRVPHDVAVIGYDDLPIAAYNNLPLTTIRQNIPLAGKLLAQNLVQHLETGVITHVTLPVELVIRETA